MSEEQNEAFIRMKYDIGTLTSRYDSEDRNRERVYERMAMIETTQARIEGKVDDILTKWRNGGTDINIKVDRLIQDQQRGKEGLWKWISIASLAISLLAIILDKI